MDVKSEHSQGILANRFGRLNLQSYYTSFPDQHKFLNSFAEDITVKQTNKAVGAIFLCKQVRCTCEIRCSLTAGSFLDNQDQDQQNQANNDGQAEQSCIQSGSGGVLRREGRRGVGW